MKQNKEDLSLKKKLSQTKEKNKIRTKNKDSFQGL
jgi:hypothetical protein